MLSSVRGGSTDLMMTSALEEVGSGRLGFQTSRLSIDADSTVFTAGQRLAGGPAMTRIATTLQAFFTERLAQQHQVSPRTIAAYRDALKLLLQFVNTRTGKVPSQLDWADIDADTISAFLNRRHHMKEKALALTTPATVEPPAATARRTKSSRSSKACDYAETATTNPRPTQATQPVPRHSRGVGIDPRPRARPAAHGQWLCSQCRPLGEGPSCSALPAW